MLSAWSRPPCSALTGSFVNGYSLPVPTLLECVLPVCTPSISSLLEENFRSPLSQTVEYLRMKGGIF